MGSHRDRLRVVAAVLLVAATVLLVVGTSLERSQAASETRETRGVERSLGEPSEHHAAAEQPTGPSQSTELGEGSGTNEAAEPTSSSPAETTELATGGGGKEATEQAGRRHTEVARHTRSREEMFGVDLEGTGLTVAAAVVSLLMAGLLLIVAGRQVLLAVVVFALVFLALDLRESLRQASEARAGLLAIALLAAVAHLGVAVLAGYRLWVPPHAAGRS